MVKAFMCIIDSRDEDKFRSFRYNDYSEKMLEYTKDKNIQIWNLIEKNHNVWAQLKANDIIYFALENDTKFEYAGHVLKIEKNSNISSQIWPNNFRSKSMDRLIFLDDFFETYVSYHKMLQLANITNGLPGLYIIQDTSQLDLPDIKEKIIEVEKLPIDIAGPPTKFDVSITRFIRDTKKTKQLKEMYENKCQICDYCLKISNNQYYSEVHHIHPLHEGGDDDHNNMIVLCPTHHAEFDYAVIGFSSDVKTIIDKKKTKVGDLHMIANHKIAQKNIDYHRRKLLQ